MSGDPRADVDPKFRLSRGQVDALRDAAYEAADPFLCQRNDLLVTLVYDTGIAPGSLVELDADAVGSDRRALVLPEGSEEDPAVVRLDPTGTLGTRRLLASYLDRRPGRTPALLPSRKADRLTARGVRYVVEDLAERAAVRPYAPDGTRGDRTDVTPTVIRRSSPRGRETGSATQTLRTACEERSGSADGSREGTVTIDGSRTDSGRLRNDRLHTGESSLETALNTVVDLFYVLDANGRLRQWNDRVPEVTGYPEAELAEIHALELIAPDERESVAEAMTAVFEDATVEKREAHLLTDDGDLVPYEFNSSPVTGRNGDVVGLAGVGRDLTEREERERELERYRRTINAVGDGIYQLDAEGNVVAVNDVAVEVTGYDREELLGEHVSKVLAPSDVEESVAVIRDLLKGEEDVGTLELTVRTADGDSIPAEARVAAHREDGEFQGTVGVIRDISERKERERELARQRDELATLARINAVIRDVDRALVRTRTREETEEAVCERLVNSDAYRFAWIGDYDAGRDRIEPRAWAGVEEGYLDDRPGSEAIDEEDVTAETAYRADEVKIARNIAENPAVAAWRDAALERGYRSAIAVPLSYREASYGVLCVYAPRSDAFDDRECAVLEELGETVAHALSAVERRRALVTDAVVELDLRVGDPSVPLVGVSGKADCELELNGTVHSPVDGLVALVTATGVDSVTVVEAASEVGAEASVVSETGDEALLRIRADTRVGIDVTDHGGVVRDASAAGGDGRFTVEFPRDVDVRTVMETVRRRYDDVELLSRHQRERTGTTGAEFRAELDDAFTDRQREVLQAAYHAGFFEWPRATTGEAIAETLGIATPTFHEHVRLGQRKLFGAYFER